MLLQTLSFDQLAPERVSIGVQSEEEIMHRIGLLLRSLAVEFFVLQVVPEDLQAVRCQAHQ